MEMPSLKLARIIYAKEPLLFTNVEAVRSILKNIEGKALEERKKRNKYKSEFYMPERPKNPYSLPESHAEKRDPKILAIGNNNILLISDLHIPYHINHSIELSLEYGYKQNINTIIINGDLIDFALISKFEKDMRKRSIKEEFAAAKQFLQYLRAAFPDVHIYWIKGNHDIRWEKYLNMKVHEIWDDPYFHLEQRLALNEERIEIINDDILVKVGKLAITHGHHIFKGIFVPVSPARGAYMRAKQNVIVGHLHRPSYHPETDMEGNIVAAWSTGCLCELKPNYSPLVSNSQHGFAHILVDNRGDFTVSNKTIINGKIH